MVFLELRRDSRVTTGNSGCLFISNAAQNCGEDKAKAISLVGTLGYAGVMIGPAVLGFIASIVSLDAIFAFSGFLMIVMGALCFVALKHKSKVN